MKIGFIWILSLLLLNTSNFAEVVDFSEEKTFAEVVTVDGEAFFKLKETDEWKKLKPGQYLPSFMAIKTSPQSYLQLLLQDNSLAHLGEKTALTFSFNKTYKFNLSHGKLRLLSVRIPKTVETAWGESQLKTGEFIWDAFHLNEKLKVEITAISGSLILDGEVLKPESYDLAPEKKPYSAYSYDYPYLLYFGEKSEDRFKSYDLVFNPSFPSRGLASEDDIEVVVEEKKTASDFVDDIPAYTPVTGEIWVHDIVYDEAVRIIEKKTVELAKEFMPTAMRTAAEYLVWDVASRSVFKWGVQYAKNISSYQVPLAVQGSYLSKRKPASTYYEKDLYRESTQQIAQVRAYRAAKVAVLKKGYEKGWQEADKYARLMLPKIITPLVSQKIYESVRPAAEVAIKKVVKQSKLIHTKDVDRLVEHLSRVASEKECKKWIELYGPRYTKVAAQQAAKEAARNAAEDIAYHMAQVSSERAGKIMGDLLARERARNVAREVAQEAKEQKAEFSRNRSKRYLIESQR